MKKIDWLGHSRVVIMTSSANGNCPPVQFYLYNMPDVGKNRTIDESLPKKHHFLNCLSSVGRNLSDSVSTHRLRVQNLQCPDCKKHLGWEEWGPPGWMERAGWEGCWCWCCWCQDPPFHDLAVQELHQALLGQFCPGAPWEGFDGKSMGAAQAFSWQFALEQTHWLFSVSFAKLLGDEDCCTHVSWKYMYIYIYLCV